MLLACEQIGGPASPGFARHVDEAAVEAATRNAEANGVQVEVRLLDAASDELPVAEIVVANIDLLTLAALPPASVSSSLVTSGYYESDRLAFSGLVHVARRAEAGWAADLFARQ